MLCLSRRRCTEEGIRIASRYFATVRRAISMPVSRNRSTMVSSERIAAGASASISRLMWWRTASAEWASPPSAEAIEAVKKYFNSKLPRLVAMYLLAVTRDTVDSCIWIASATAFKFSRSRGLRDTVGEETVLLAHDFGGDLQNGAGALVERAHQPGRILQRIGEIGFVAVLADRLRQLGVIDLIDQHARQRGAASTCQPPSGPGRT